MYPFCRQACWLPDHSLKPGHTLISVGTGQGAGRHATLCPSVIGSILAGTLH